MGSDRLGENEYLVRDGTAKVLFCALAWTFGQWAGSGRISSTDPPQLAFTQCDNLMELLRNTVSTTSRGFKMHGRVGEVHGKQKPGDSHGIRAVVKQERLAEFGLLSNAVALKTAHSLLMEVMTPVGACPFTRLYSMFEHDLVHTTYASICGYAPSVFSALKNWRSNFACSSDVAESGGELVRRNAELSREFNSAASLARILIGSTRSIERTTLCEYQAGTSLDKVQDFPAGQVTASPIPLAMLIRLARIFGFSPVCDEQASAEDVSAGCTKMPANRRKVWDAYCGELEGDDTLRGACHDDFTTFFIAALDAGELGPLPGDAVEIKSRRDRERRTQKKNTLAKAPVAESASALIPGHRAYVIVNALSADPDNIGMTIDLQLDEGRIVLRSIRYQLDREDADATADLRLCLRRIVIRWDWGQGILVMLEDADEAALRQSIISANPELNIGSVETDTATLRFGFGPEQAGEALAPRPAVAVKRLTLPRATLAADDAATHRFELLAYWRDVGFQQREADGTFRLHDRAALRDLLTESDSGMMLLREYYAQIEHRFPTDGQLHRIGSREARIQRQALPAVASISA